MTLPSGAIASHVEWKGGLFGRPFLLNESIHRANSYLNAIKSGFLRMLVPELVPEWSRQSFIWVGWPSDAELWQTDLAPAQAETAVFVHALSETIKVRLVASGSEATNAARAACSGRAEICDQNMGDIWLRDTGPIYAGSAEGLVGLTFAFNGWGGKYRLDGDTTIADALLADDGVDNRHHPFILEGGAIDWDGAGTLLTTRQCLLNPNRNPGWTEDIATDHLRKALGVNRIIWLDEGLTGDHTDGHVDNLARFVGPGRVVCQTPSGPADPNARIYQAAETALRTAGFEVVTIPSPGDIRDSAGAIMPASHLNFVFANGQILMPHYETTHANEAIKALRAALPDQRITSLPARHLLTGGGAFHCMTQQVPAGKGLQGETG